jgi:hypothetical protein
MRAQSVTVLAVVSLACLYGGRAGAQLSPEMLPAYMASMELNTSNLTDSILKHPFVPEADKEKVRAIVKNLHEVMAKAQEEAKAGPDAAQAAMQKMQEATKDLTELLAERPDLKWVEQRSGMCQTLKGSLIGDMDGSFLSALKLAAGEAKANQAKALLDGMLAEARKANAAVTADPENRAKAMETAVESSKRLDAALKAIDALLTPEQRAAFEWTLTHGKDVDEHLFNVIGYSTLPGMLTALADGDYVLMTTPQPAPGKFAGQPPRGTRSGGPVPQPVEVARVNLAKGDPIGFKKQGEKMMAVGGSKMMDLPAEMVRWEYVAPNK